MSPSITAVRNPSSSSSVPLLFIALAILLLFTPLLPSICVSSCEILPHFQHLRQDHYHQDEDDAELIVTMQTLVQEEEKVDAAAQKCLDPTTASAEKSTVENVKLEASTTAKDSENNEATSNENGNSNNENEEDIDSLLQQANDLYKDDKLLASARILRRLNNNKNNNNSSAILTPQHHKILRQAQDCESLIDQLMKPPATAATASTASADEWIKLGERHDGKHNSMIYYSQPNATTFKTRIETPIPSNLLVPLLSVLNETDLYSTWLPYWKIPFRLGVASSTKLQQKSRVSQIIQVKVDVPFPFAKREVIIDAISLDDIEASGQIAIRMTTPEADGEVVPPVEKGVMRQEFEGGFLFCKCPSDHPALVPSGEEGDDEAEDKILVYFTVTIQDNKLHLFPQALINFVTRIVVGKMWDMFLRVAEEVKDGERPQHSAAIEEKREVLYDWVEERILAMFERLKTSSEE